MSAPERRGILEFLDFNNALKTPAFQRSFAWEQAQIDDFWNDLRRSLDAQKGPEDYFLGLIVLDDSDEIQDGQQRLATTLLLAARIYDSIEAAKNQGTHDSQLAKDAAAQVTSALRQSPNAPLIIGAQDQDVLLNRAGIRSDVPESAKRLDAARRRLGDRFKKDLEGKGTPDARLARLKQWGAFLRENAYTVLLRVPPKDAHNIFETLNTRGVRLSNGDLVKSHLIARSSDTALAVGKWNQITDRLKEASGKYEEHLESFLLHFYGSRFEKTTKARFFADYRTAIESVDALAALDELLESARLYHALVDPRGASSFWSPIGAEAQHAVELLNGLGLKQLRYLLLSVLRDLGAEQAEKPRKKKQRDAVVKIAAWSMRGLVHGRTGGGEAEKTYISAAKAIREGKIATVAGLKALFTERNMLVLNDSLFRQAFEEFRFDSQYSHNRARSVLYALEFHKMSHKAGVVPKPTLTLEHLLPQSPEPGDWSAFSEDERRIYTWKLGNLLLVDGPSRANDSLGNLEWPEKKTKIQSWGDQTPLTTEALKFKQWTTATIDKRTKALASLAVSAWKA